MNQEQGSAASQSPKIESWASYVLVALVFLLPIIFIPVPYLQQNAVKGYLMAFGILASAILYGVSRIKSKSFEWIKHPLTYVGIVLALVLVVSSAWSGNFMKYFFGQGYEYFTAAFLILLLIGSRLSALFSSRSSSRALWLYAAVLGSYAFLALFQVIKLFSPSSLSFGNIFSGATSTPIGSWFDLGIFSGIILIISAFAFIYFPMKNGTKWSVGVALAVSTFFLLLIGLPLIWLGIALVFLALAFHQFFDERKGVPFTKRIPIIVLAAFIIVALITWKGGSITTWLDAHMNTGYTPDVLLPWQNTLDIGTGILKASPILGSGPNTFAKEYLLYKPLNINQTQYWMTEFSSGTSLILTMALTLGLSGIILFSLLYVYFIRDGMRALCARKSSENTRGKDIGQYVLYSSFFVGAFLLYADLIGVPSCTDFFLTFIFIGIFIGSRINSGSVPLVAIPFQFKNKTAVYGHSIAVLFVLVLCAGFVWYGMKASAFGYFTKGAAIISASPFSTDSINAAKADFKKSLALDPMDIYDQALVQTDLIAISALAQKVSSGGANAKLSQDQVGQIGSLITEASTYALDAIKRDPSNYYNYMALGQVHSTAASIQITGAYAGAVKDYTDAAKDNPYDPAIYLTLAQLAAQQGKYDDATGYIGSALGLKSNYTSAVYLLSQIQVVQGKTSDAITSVKFATELTPNDPTAFFELGLLQYNAGSFTDAATSLAKAVSLSPDYANAQYFLGLSYAKTGDTNDAIMEFQELTKTNPDNADVASILKNLIASKTPFANQKPPTSTPEKRSALPVQDTANNSTKI